MKRRPIAGGSVYILLLLAVALMGLAATTVQLLMVLEKRRDNERELLSVGNEIRQAILRYYVYKDRNMYPSSFDDLLKDPRELGTVRHLRKIYVDPMTGKPDWVILKNGAGLVGVHSRSIKRPLKQSGFGVFDRGFENAQSYQNWSFTWPANFSAATVKQE